MSNNIYDILKKIENLESPKKALTESKAMNTVKELHNESKKEKQTGKGTIAEAVAQVEKQLNEKYKGFKKTVDEGLKLQGTIKPTDSGEEYVPEPGYRVKAEFEPGTGKQKMGFVKAEPETKTPQAAMPSDTKDKPVDESGLQAYLGKKKYGETGMKALQKAGREGASKEKMAMIRAKHDKMDEAVGQEGPADLLAAIEQEIARPGRSTNNLTDVLNATFGSDRSPEFKKARAVIGKYLDLVDNASVGSEEDGIAPMRGGNIARHIQQYDLTDYLQHAAAMLDKAVKGPMKEGNQEGPADLLAAIEQEINNPGRSIDNLLDVLNATFGSDRSPEFKKARAVIGKYIDLVDNAAMGSEQDGIAPMRGGNIARHIQQYDLTDYLQHAAAMLDKAVKGPMSEGSYNEDMLSAKEKSFAALAEPKDKITYADKIAGAKQGKKTEGNKFSGNLMKARAQGKDQADLDGDGDMEKVSKGASTMREGWDEMQKYLDKKKGPESKGGAGKKAGTRYGGSAQKDDDEETDGEGKPVEKKKGRPKGTGGGAKFSFKKPKD
jgi:hypothetical protein